MAIFTFAEWSKFVPPLYQAFFNTVINKDPWFRFLPTAMWGGGTHIENTIKVGNPTISSLSEGGTVTESAGSYAKMFTYLSELGGQTAVDVHSNANYLGMAGNNEARAYADLAEAYAIKVRDLGINGGYMTEANVTLNTLVTGGATNNGIDSVDAVSCAMPKGSAALKFDDTADTLEFRAPGSVTYGTAVDVSGGDGAYTLYDGENSLHWVTITIDFSDWDAGGDFEIADAFTFQHPEEMKGLKALSDLDSNQIVGATGANGDTTSIDVLDHIDQLCHGMFKIYIVPQRTERSIRTLKMGLGGSDSQDFERNPLNGLVHNGHPVVTSAGIGLDEAKGGTSTCSRIYCVSLDADEGLKFLFGRQDGAPVLREYPGVDRSERSGGPLSVPVFLRNIGEKQTLNQSIVRCTGSGTLWLDNTKYLAVATGITD